MDSRLVGTWETYDGPCKPCTLTIPESGQPTFAQAGSAVQVVFARITPDPGIDLIFPQGGKADLVLSGTGHNLVGSYTTWDQRRSNMPVSFTRAGASASAVDEWFVLGEQTIKAVDRGVYIKSEGGRWTKDVKQAKLSVEGADVELTKVILHWDNRKDDTFTGIGVLQAGGSTTPQDAPGRKGRLTAVTVEYKIVGEAPTAVLKIWGYD
jgi:hypothetical protein